MRADANIFLIICLLFLAGTATAASTISKTSGDWIIANGHDSFQVTVSVRNTSGLYEGPVDGAAVEFSTDPVYGTASSDFVTTGPDGLATTTFTVGTRSGETSITATVSYNDAEVAVDKTLTPLTQLIDHDTRWIFSPLYITHPPAQQSMKQLS